jgi:hypothetical protein
MSVLFESILLFGLAVLVIIVGLLIYYFKNRIVDIEQKNTKCLEIAQDVYMQQIQMKNEIYSILFPKPNQSYEKEEHIYYNDDKIRVELSEDEVDNKMNDNVSDNDECESDESDSNASDDESNSNASDSNASDNESDSNAQDNTKIVSVDLTFPEICEINIDEESDLENSDNELESIEPQHIIVSKIEVPEEPLKKQLTTPKDDLQKMTPSALKSLLISKGIPNENISKLKKKELVEMLANL